MNLTPDVANVLERGRPQDTLYFLPAEQLDRKLYTDVNRVLECLGGKWDRRQKAHVFPDPVSERLAQVLASGVVTDRKKELGFFETPRPVLDALLVAAEIQDGMRVLEPSAGHGNIALHIRSEHPACQVVCCELDAANADYLIATGEFGTGETCQVFCWDFLTTEPDDHNPRFDRVVMNPPFSVPGNPQADIDHVRKAYDWLKPGGRLVSVMSAGVRFRENRKTTEFREWVASRNGSFRGLPEQAFRDSGTDVRTCYVVVEKPV